VINEEAPVTCKVAVCPTGLVIGNIIGGNLLSS